MELDNNVLQRGRKKVFSAKQKLALVLPNGKKDGELEEGDLIYVVQRTHIEGKDVFRFKVMKFHETEKQGTVYTSETKYFEPHYTEERLNAEGKDASTSSATETDSKMNLLVPSITGAAFGAFGYFLAKRKGKNTLLFGLGGTIVGGVIGVLLYKLKK